MPKWIYSLQKDKEDNRDFLYRSEQAAALPSSYDIRNNCPPVYDQGKQGSCSSHAGCACRSMLAKSKTLDLSRAFLYWQERVLNGTTNEDSGATIRDICKATNKSGICETIYMPYSDSDYKTAPSEKADQNAVQYKITGYNRLAGAGDIKQALVSRNQPVLIGMTVFESMESETVAKTGVLPMPKPSEKQLGGHAVLIVGYCDKPAVSFFRRFLNFLFRTTTSGYFIVRNSWGANWGQKGYFQMPYDYFNKYTFDYWIMN